MKPSRIAAWTIALFLHACLVIYATLPMHQAAPRIEPPAGRADVLIVSILHHNPRPSETPKPPAMPPVAARAAADAPPPKHSMPVQPRRRPVRVAARPQDLVSAPLKRPDVPPREIASFRVTETPQYPLNAFGEKGAEGWVVLIVLVGPDGLPEGISVSRSVSPQIDEAAIAAVSRWKFEPGLLNGRAVPSWISVPIGFFRGHLSNGSVHSRES
ncbi:MULTISPECIES: energy transducer TonB [unclassified Rhodanobacter]|uniref:energy transducer TonB n=1 Tax=unclassified Rhodanobacter TaxID=2621553 RepID=UPI0007A9C17C|nr:energy transducer TonB [Rhodanobacter sp. FW510-R10]KZC32603.1 hypothetical protein RhoFW510R10_11855 [Rhodanobacter sp. FW510-R10]